METRAFSRANNSIINEDECNDTYGRIRMHEALQMKFPDENIPSERTVYHVMERLGVSHTPRRKPNGITKAEREARKSDDLLKRDFNAEKPCEKCVTDITEISAKDGKLYVSAIFDCFDVSVLGLSMEEAYKEGRLRAIGVSNFYPDRLVDLCQFVEVKPAVNQVETHVFQQQKRAHEYMEKYGVQHESWGPFAERRKDFFTNPVLAEIGNKYNKSAAQAALRFLIQSNVVVIPKSTHKERMEQNFDVFDFTLSAEDMTAIQKLDEGECLFFSHYDPATVEMITGLHR